MSKLFIILLFQGFWHHSAQKLEMVGEIIRLKLTRTWVNPWGCHQAKKIKHSPFLRPLVTARQKNFILWLQCIRCWWKCFFSREKLAVSDSIESACDSRAKSYGLGFDESAPDSMESMGTSSGFRSASDSFASECKFSLAAKRFVSAPDALESEHASFYLQHSCKLYQAPANGLYMVWYMYWNTRFSLFMCLRLSTKSVPSNGLQVVGWNLSPLLLTTSASICLQHSPNHVRTINGRPVHMTDPLMPTRSDSAELNEMIISMKHYWTEIKSLRFWFCECCRQVEAEVLSNSGCTTNFT